LARRRIIEMGKNLWICLALLAAACGGTEPGELDEQNPRGEDAFVNSTVIWPTTIIHVCREDDSPSDATQRGWVQDAVTKTWRQCPR
jgi:hypothetical protein